MRRFKGKIEWDDAFDIGLKIKKLIADLEIDWVDPEVIYTFRSQNANTRAVARIWGLSKIWQQALDRGPAYIIEVISERFDQLPPSEQDKVLLHEITHIPRNFSGALLPHKKRGAGSFHDRLHEIIARYEERQ